MDLPNKTRQAFIDMSNRLFRHQLRSDYFFDEEFLKSVKESFNLKNILIVVYNDNAEFHAMIDNKGFKKNDSNHLYHAFSRRDPCSRFINISCASDKSQFARNDPIFRSTDILSGQAYDDSEYARFLNQSANYHYSLAMPFGPRGRFHLAFYKRQEEGDFTEQETAFFRDVYSLCFNAYKAFEELRLQRALCSFQTEQNATTRQHCEVILDSDFKVIYVSDNASDYLSVLYAPADASIIGSRLNFLELLFHVQTDIHAPLCAEYKAHFFSIEPIFQTDQLGFSKIYYRLKISKSPLQLPTNEIYSELINCLTKREHEVALQMAKGLTYREAGEHLHISTSTVRNHMQHIYRKLQINNQRQLMKLFHPLVDQQ